MEMKNLRHGEEAADRGIAKHPQLFCLFQGSCRHHVRAATVKSRLVSLISPFLAACSLSPATPAKPTCDRHLVLVHGFLENGSAFHVMKRRLEKQGYQCLVPKLKPSDGRGGLETLAASLKRDIDAAYGTDQRFSIIAFSMGGIVSRHYLQHLGGAPRCRSLFTISSPHHGTRAAWLYPTKGAEQMRPNSPFLAELQRTEHRLGRMPVVSYRTPLDLIIVPSSSSKWDRAENVSHPALLHPLMVTSPTILRDIETRLAGREPR
jgi:triacylglycerol lipase